MRNQILMNYIKKLNLCILLSAIISLQAQDDNSIKDNEDLILIYDNCPEELYPLEDSDTILLISDIQSCVDNLELDPSAKEIIQTPEIIEIIDITILPTTPEAMVILDRKQEPSEPQNLNQEMVQQQDEVIVTDDDDIIPVPHDLINSVKKAAKKKKKLEKLERKEKARLFKKSKKKKKQSCDVVLN